MSDEDPCTCEIESVFGKGLAYCLGLFLAHAERKATWDKPPIWFNGASDHVGEMQVDHAPEQLRKRMASFRDKVWSWGHGFQPPEATQEDREWAVQEAKDLLRALDDAHGVPTCQGGYE